jgi:hypothetical protein
LDPLPFGRFGGHFFVGTPKFDERCHSLGSRREKVADDLTKKGPQDRSRVSLTEDYEVRYWSEKFGVSAEELQAAVNKVGNSAKAVEQELAG